MEHASPYKNTNIKATIDLNKCGNTITDNSSNNSYYSNEVPESNERIMTSSMINQTHFVSPNNSEPYNAHNSFQTIPCTSNMRPLFSNVGYFPIFPFIPHVMNSHLNRSFVRDILPHPQISNLFIPNLLPSNMYNPFTPFNTNNGLQNFLFHNQRLVDSSSATSFSVPSLMNEQLGMNADENVTSKVHTCEEQPHESEEQQRNNNQHFYVGRRKQENKRNQSSNYFNKICPYFLKGICNRGHHCRFIHPEEEKTNQENKNEKVLSTASILENKENENKEENNEHKTGSQSIEDTYKTRMCIYFLLNGACRLGDTCRFAHGEHELRKKNKKKKKKKNKKKKKKDQVISTNSAQSTCQNTEESNKQVSTEKQGQKRETETEHKKELIETSYKKKWNMQRPNENNLRTSFVKEKKHYIENKIERDPFKHIHKYQINRNYNKNGGTYRMNGNPWFRFYNRGFIPNKKRIENKETKKIIGSKTEYSTSDTYTEVKCMPVGSEKFEKINHRNSMYTNNINVGSTSCDRGSSERSEHVIKENTTFGNVKYKTSHRNTCCCNRCTRKSGNHNQRTHGFHRVPLMSFINENRRVFYGNKINHKMHRYVNNTNNEKMFPNNFQSSSPKNPNSLPLNSIHMMNGSLPSFHPIYFVQNPESAQNGNCENILSS